MWLSVYKRLEECTCFLGHAEECTASNAMSQPSCATTRAISPKGNRQVTIPATSAAGAPIPATRVTATSVHDAPTLATARRARGGQQMQRYDQQVAAKTLCHSASWPD